MGRPRGGGSGTYGLRRRSGGTVLNPMLYNTGMELMMECFEDVLSPSQIEAARKAKEEYKKAQKKIEEAKAEAARLAAAAKAEAERQAAARAEAEKQAAEAAAAANLARQINSGNSGSTSPDIMIVGESPPRTGQKMAPPRQSQVSLPKPVSGPIINSITGLLPANIAGVPQEMYRFANHGPNNNAAIPQQSQWLLRPLQPGMVAARPILSPGGPRQPGIPTSQNLVTIVSGTSGLGIKRALGKLEEVTVSPPSKKIRGRFVNESGNGGNGGSWVPLDEYYYGKMEGDPTFLEDKGEFRFRCWICTKMLYNNVKAMMHLQGHIDSEKQQNLDLSDLTQCKHCYKQFDTPFEMQTHIEKVHLSNMNVLMCRICEKDHESRGQLTTHMRQNHCACEMPYTCQLCHFRSSMYSDVVDHFKKKHDSSDSMLCLYCLRVFHVKFVSQGWGQTQVYYHHLLRHQSKTGNRKCTFCKLSFFNTQDMKAHRKAHHLPNQKGVIGVTVKQSTPDQVMIKVGESGVLGSSKLGGGGPKSLNAPAVSKVLEHRGLRMPSDTALSHCFECNMLMNTSDHYKKYIQCSMCRFATSCSFAYATHMMGFHSGQLSALSGSVPSDRSLPGPLHCLCGFSSKFGNQIANHLVHCSKRTGYLNKPELPVVAEKPGPDETDPRHKPDASILDVLGLVKKPCIVNTSVEEEEGATATPGVNNIPDKEDKTQITSLMDVDTVKSPPPLERVHWDEKIDKDASPPPKDTFSEFSSKEDMDVSASAPATKDSSPTHDRPPSLEEEERVPEQSQCVEEEGSETMEKAEAAAASEETVSETCRQQQQEDRAAPEAEDTAAPEAADRAAPEAEDSAAPEAEDSAAPEAEDRAAPEAEDSAAPEAEDTAAPEAEDTAAPEAEDRAAPEAEDGAAPEAEDLAEAEDSAASKVDDDKMVEDSDTSKVDDDKMVEDSDTSKAEDSAAPEDKRVEDSDTSKAEDTAAPEDKRVEDSDTSKAEDTAAPEGKMVEDSDTSKSEDTAAPEDKMAENGDTSKAEDTAGAEEEQSAKGEDSQAEDTGAMEAEDCGPLQAEDQALAEAESNRALQDWQQAGDTQPATSAAVHPQEASSGDLPRDESMDVDEGFPGTTDAETEEGSAAVRDEDIGSIAAEPQGGRGVEEEEEEELLGGEEAMMEDQDWSAQDQVSTLAAGEHTADSSDLPQHLVHKPQSSREDMIAEEEVQLLATGGDEDGPQNLEPSGAEFSAGESGSAPEEEEGASAAGGDKPALGEQMEITLEEQEEAVSEQPPPEEAQTAEENEQWTQEENRETVPEDTAQKEEQEEEAASDTQTEDKEGEDMAVQAAPEEDGGENAADDNCTNLNQDDTKKDDQDSTSKESKPEDEDTNRDVKPEDSREDKLPEHEDTNRDVKPEDPREDKLPEDEDTNRNVKPEDSREDKLPEDKAKDRRWGNASSAGAQPEDSAEAGGSEGTGDAGSRDTDRAEWRGVGPSRGEGGAYPTAPSSQPTPQPEESPAFRRDVTSHKDKREENQPHPPAAWADKGRGSSGSSQHPPRPYSSSSSSSSDRDRQHSRDYDHRDRDRSHDRNRDYSDHRDHRRDRNYHDRNRDYYDRHNQYDRHGSGRYDNQQHGRYQQGGYQQQGGYGSQDRYYNQNRQGNRGGQNRHGYNDRNNDRNYYNRGYY